MSLHENNKLNRSFFLKHKSEIQFLFKNGERFKSDILNTVWHIDNNSQESGIKVFISVPKRCLIKASDRNLVKRRIKEAIRLNLQNLKTTCAEENISLSYAVVYSKNNIEAFNNIESKIVISLQKIYSKIYENKE